jgi:hypothetical protein
VYIQVVYEYFFYKFAANPQPTCVNKLLPAFNHILYPVAEPHEVSGQGVSEKDDLHRPDQHHHKSCNLLRAFVYILVINARDVFAQGLQVGLLGG